MQIRRAAEDDLIRVASWFSTAAEATRWGGPLIPFPLVLAELKVAMEWGAAEAYVLEADELLGFAQVSDKFGYRHLSRIAIAPEMRGQGLGRELLQRLMQPAQSYALFVYADNAPAIRLYQKLGFVSHAHPRDFVEGCLFMVKR